MQQQVAEFNQFASLLEATQVSPPGGGTDRQAIEFALNHLPDFEALGFLKDWLKGDLSGWEDFQDFLVNDKGSTA